MKIRNIFTIFTISLPDSDDNFWKDFSEQAEAFKVLRKDVRKIFRTSLCELEYKKAARHQGLNILRIECILELLDR